MKFGLTGRESWTDNVKLMAKGQSDILTTVNPTFNAEAKTKRLQLDLNYDGAYDAYVANTDLNGFRHDGTVISTLEMLERRAFLDLRGNVSEQNINPSAVTTAGPRTSPVNRTRVMTYNISPRIEENFGSWGVGKVSVSHAESRNDTLDVNQGTGLLTPAAGNVLGNTSIDSGLLDLRSGSLFPELQWDLSGNVSRSKLATGNSDQMTGQFGVEYRWNENVGLLLDSGYDYIKGLNVSGTRTGGIFYNGGIHWTPSPNTDIKGGAGWRYKGVNVYFLGDVHLGPKTTLHLSHDTSFGTDAQNTVSRLNAVQVGRQGQILDPITGMPANPASSPFTGTNSVYQKETTDLVLRRTSERDTINLSGSLSSQNILSGGQSALSTITGIPLATSSTVAIVTLNWSHHLTPLTTVIATASGSDVIEASTPAARVKRLQLGLESDYQLANNLTATLNYRFSNSFQPPQQVDLRLAGDRVGRIIENFISVELRYGI